MNKVPEQISVISYADEEFSRWRGQRTFEANYENTEITPENGRAAFFFLVTELGLSFDVRSADEATGYTDAVFVRLRHSKLNLTVHESVATWVAEVLTRVDLARPEHRVLWWFMNKDEPVASELLLRGHEPKDEFYPWMPQSIAQFADEFARSDSNVLVLVGPPGTGKTSFIRGVVRRMQYETWVTYDPKVQDSEQFYVNFSTPANASEDTSPEYRKAEIKPDKRCLVMEDADEMLMKRADGNKLMNRILNLSDGITALPSRKIIFSTNLPGLKSIDDALLRPGRCFAAIRFRDLTRYEAASAAKAIGLELNVDKDRMTLSEALNSHQRGNLEVQTIGF